MGISVFRLGMAIMWLTMAVGLYFRSYLPEDFRPKIFDGHNADLLMVVGFVLGLWNLVRWYASRNRSVDEVEEPKPRRRIVEAERPHEYLPEFDFTKPNDPSKE